MCLIVKAISSLSFIKNNTWCERKQKKSKSALQLLSSSVHFEKRHMGKVFVLWIFIIKANYVKCRNYFNLIKNVSQVERINEKESRRDNERKKVGKSNGKNTLITWSSEEYVCATVMNTSRTIENIINIKILSSSHNFSWNDYSTKPQYITLSQMLNAAICPIKLLQMSNKTCLLHIKVTLNLFFIAHKWVSWKLSKTHRKMIFFFILRAKNSEN